MRKKIRKKRNKPLLVIREVKEVKEQTNSKSKWKLFIFLSPVLVIIGYIVLFTDLYTGVIKPIYHKIFPESFYRDSLDNNVHGEFLRGLRGANKDSLVFVFGSSGTKYYLNNYYQSNNETYACWFPNKWLILFQNAECPFFYRFDKTGQVLFSGTISGYDNETILLLSDNELVLNDSNIFSWNGDDYGFEIVDKNNKVLFSINYVPPHKIYVQGIFNDKKRHVGIVDRTIVIIPYDEPEKLLSSRDSIVRLFEYTGRDWKSKRVNNNFQ